MRITKEMTIEEVVMRYPQTIPVFTRYGIGCMGCSASQYDDVATGARVHGLDADQLVRELNESIAAQN